MKIVSRQVISVQLPNPFVSHGLTTDVKKLLTQLTCLNMSYMVCMVLLALLKVRFPRSDHPRLACSLPLAKSALLREGGMHYEH